MSELFPADRCVFNLICIFVAFCYFHQRLINLYANSCWNLYANVRFRQLVGTHRNTCQKRQSLFGLFLVVTFINQDLNAICKPETLAGDCEAYWRWTQTSGRRRKQKLQTPPSVRQASLLSLRKDQWQFEPLEFVLFLIFSLKKYCCETVSPGVNIQPEPVRLRVLVVKESLATKNVKIYNKTWKAIIVRTSQWNQGYLSSCS